MNNPVEISKKITKIVGRTNGEYKLIGEGDRVLLGLSGGKDSMNLAHILKRMQRHAPFNFEFQAVTIDYGMGEDLSGVIAHCEEHEIPLKVKKTEINDIAQENIRKNSSFCSFVSRMRRGYLYTEALENGFNKVALGHHLDDAVESFFMNMLYNGSLRTMPPIYTANNGLKVIRPMIMVRERQLRDSAIKNEIPVVGDENCPAFKQSVKMPYARAQVKEMLEQMEQDNGELFVSLKSSFSHLHTSTFFDPKYYE
jgi:tRNA(Ile)-lysidine synthase TilS/MesJ